MRSWTTIALLLAAGWLSAGCRTNPGPPPPPLPPPPQLPTTERQIAPVDVAQLPSDPQPIAQPPLQSGLYHRLTAEECHQLACAHTPIAHLIEVAATEGNDRPLLDFTPRAVDRLRRRIAGHLSREARIRTAAAALDLYYRLLEAELLADALTESQRDLDELVKIGEAMNERGFRESSEFLTLRKQQVELRAERARLQSGLRQLNAELKLLIGLYESPGPILPADQIQVVAEPIDPEQAVRLGLASRPDLLLLRELSTGLDRRTVEAVRQALLGLVPPLEAISKTTRILAPGLRALFPYLAYGDVNSLRRQITLRLSEREREADKDIRTAVDAWLTQRELVAIAKKRVEVEARRVQDLEVKRKAGAAVELDYRRARLDLLKARADLIREAVKWRQADIRARREMGVLCQGFCGPLCP